MADDLLGYWLNAERVTRPVEGRSPTPAGRRERTRPFLEHRGDTAWADSELLLSGTTRTWSRPSRTLKQRARQGHRFHGGVRTAQALTRLDLIDEYQLVVPPVALGEGEPLFRNLPDRLKLKLVHVRELEAGGVFLHYQPASKA